jgi:hypothetical protein
VIPVTISSLPAEAQLMISAAEQFQRMQASVNQTKALGGSFMVSCPSVF